MTTVTTNELVTEEKLRFIARERNLVEQRRMYERLLAGQLRCTRALHERSKTLFVAADGLCLDLVSSGGKTHALVRTAKGMAYRLDCSPPSA